MTNHTEITEAELADHAAFLSSWADDIDRNAGGHSVDAARLRRITAALQASTSPPAEPSAGDYDYERIYSEARRRMMRDVTGGFYDEHLARTAFEHGQRAALTKGSPTNAG